MTASVKIPNGADFAMILDGMDADRIFDGICGLQLRHSDISNRPDLSRLSPFKLKVARIETSMCRSSRSP